MAQKIFVNGSKFSAPVNTYEDRTGTDKAELRKNMVLTNIFATLVRVTSCLLEQMFRMWHI